MTRRTFLRVGALASAAMALEGSPRFGTLKAAARSSGADLVHDTLNGLVAFVVPGPDPYSVAQGQSTVEPGGLDAAITPILVDTLDQSAPYLPGFSSIVAAVLNDLAMLVRPSPNDAFSSPFAGLLFEEKVAVVQIMDATEELKPLSGLLPGIVALLVYSEGSSFDPSTRSVTEHPVGWAISNYDGVADGRDELLGYFENRRKARMEK